MLACVCACCSRRSVLSRLLFPSHSGTGVDPGGVQERGRLRDQAVAVPAPGEHRRRGRRPLRRQGEVFDHLVQRGRFAVGGSASRRHWSWLRHSDQRLHHSDHGYAFRINGYNIRTNGYNIRTNLYTIRTNGYTSRTNSYTIWTNGYAIRNSGYTIRTNSVAWGRPGRCQRPSSRRAGGR